MVSVAWFHTVVPLVQVQSVTSCPTVRMIYSMTLRVCVACVDGFGGGARCGWQEKPGYIQTIPMAGIFAGHVKTWFCSANTPDKDSHSTTEPADGLVTCLLTHAR